MDCFTVAKLFFRASEPTISGPFLALWIQAVDISGLAPILKSLPYGLRDQSERRTDGHEGEHTHSVLDLDLRPRERERPAYNCSFIGLVSTSMILSQSGREFQAS